MNATVIDAAWLDAHPLPGQGDVVDKNSRGRILVAGGAHFVPGALRLTGEAALRAGAGKLQLATVEAVANALGVLVPEAAMIALPADSQGEIAAEAAALLENAFACSDAVVFGPGTSKGDRTTELVRRIFSSATAKAAVLLDAAAICCATELAGLIAAYPGEVVMTPHYGECAQLTGLSIDEIRDDAENMAARIAREFNAVIVLKAARTVIAGPDGTALSYESDCVGLATSGSGDVLAGVVGGLLARGAPAIEAAGWGVWLHAEAGKLCSQRIGTTGFLARDLLPLIPGLHNR